MAADGVLWSWDGGALLAERHENNLWWLCRRDLSVGLPSDDAVLTSRTGVPYLAPEVRLLFESANPRPKGQIDAAEVIPALEPARRDRLAGWLAPGHSWHGLLHRGT